MQNDSWNELKIKHPELATRAVVLGSELYEMGAERAAKSERLGQLRSLLETAPPEAQAMLGLKGNVSSASILRAIFEQGSSLLLQYVRTGRC